MLGFKTPTLYAYNHSSPVPPACHLCLVGRDGLLGYRTVLDAWLSFQTKTKILPAGGLRGDRRWDTMSIECYIELSYFCQKVYFDWVVQLLPIPR